MRKAILALVVVAIVGGGVATLLWKHRETPAAQRARLVDGFLTCLPDSLDDQHRKEISGLFDMLWKRADMGLVDPADVDSITVKAKHYIDAGSISGKDLVYFMAEVGYTTYKGESRYNLPGGVVDHPVLNPDAALITLKPDTTGYAKWYAEQMRKEREAEAGTTESGDSAQTE